MLHGRARVVRLLRLWGAIYVANLAGSLIFAKIAAVVGPALGVIDLGVLGDIAHGAVDHPSWVIFLSALLAGWLMGLLSWLISAARDSTSQVLLVGIITWSIGFAHLHHTVVGSAEVLAGIFANQGLDPGAFAHFLVWTTFGNAAGGVFFVAVFKYSHVIRGGTEPEAVKLDAPNSIIIDASQH